MPMFEDFELEQSHAEWAANMLIGNVDTAAEIVLFQLRILFYPVILPEDHVASIAHFLQSFPLSDFSMQEFRLVIKVSAIRLGYNFGS